MYWNTGHVYRLRSRFGQERHTELRHNNSGHYGRGLNLSMSVRLLTEADEPAYFTLRVEALEREPYAFSRSPEEERARTPESRAARLQAKSEGNFVLGGFKEAVLVGMGARL